MSTPYGAWPSPLEADRVAESGRQLANVQLDGDWCYWLERRPAEGGRGVIMRSSLGESDAIEAITPDDVDVRTLVHQYGGGDFLVADGIVWFAALEDQRLYRQVVEGEEAGEPTPITPEPPSALGHRYADMARSPDGDWLYAVRERHLEGEPEPRNELVAIPESGGEPTIIAEGHDFYAAPRPSPDGTRLAYVRWDHPRMPWDGTELVVADCHLEDGPRLEGSETVVGGPEESVFDPQWHPDDGLYAVSDRTGWWNLYCLGTDPRRGDLEHCYPAEMEFGVPQWVFGLSTYAFLEDGRIATLVIEDGRSWLGLLERSDDGESWSLHKPELPFSAYGPASLRSNGETLTAIGGQPTRPTAVFSWTPSGGRDGGEKPEPVSYRTAMDLELEAGYLAEPEPITFPTGDAVDADETEAYAHFYPPTNPDVDAPSGERPPVVVTVHGGPTSRSPATLSLTTQYFTSRGIAVLDVNYRGSTGYGRAYRDALAGQWGVRDTLDCINAARYAAREGLVDPDRQAISGGSAGGYAVLAALADDDTFDAGASYYGVADLEGLAADTHKFESRYLDGLVGPLPDARETYRDRSPVHNADGITAPLLLLQGGEDEVVPPSQAATMIDALAGNETPYAYVEFPEERHGFRDADNQARALEAEFAFYATVFGFEPADDLENVPLLEGERVAVGVETEE